MKKIILTTIIGLGLTSSFFYIGTVAREKADKPVVQQKEEQSEKNEIQGDEKEEKKEEKQQQETEKKTVANKKPVQEQQQEAELKSTVSYEEVMKYKQALANDPRAPIYYDYNSMYAVMLAIDKATAGTKDLDLYLDDYRDYAGVKIDIKVDSKGHFKVNRQSILNNRDLNLNNTNVDDIIRMIEGIIDKRLLDIKNNELVYILESHYMSEFETNIYLKSKAPIFRDFETIEQQGLKKLPIIIENIENKLLNDWHLTIKDIDINLDFKSKSLNIKYYMYKGTNHRYNEIPLFQDTTTLIEQSTRYSLDRFDITPEFMELDEEQPVEQ